MDRRRAWIFNFLRLVAATAIRGRRFVAQKRFHSRPGMAAGAGHVISERGKCAVTLELVAEGAIGPESSAGVNARMRVHMLCMRKFENDRPLVLIARVRQQIVAASGRKDRMALHADFFVYILVKVVRVARCALIMPRPLKGDRACLRRNMTTVAIETHLLDVKFVQVERSLHIGLGLRRRCI